MTALPMPSDLRVWEEGDDFKAEYTEPDGNGGPLCTTRLYTERGTDVFAIGASKPLPDGKGTMHMGTALPSSWTVNSLSDWKRLTLAFILGDPSLTIRAEDDQRFWVLLGDQEVVVPKGTTQA